MATREEIEAELSRLEAVLSGGVTRVSKGDRSAEYDLDAVRRRRDELKGQLDRLGQGRQVRRVYLRGC